MAYTYDNLFAVDPNNPLMVAANASITVFDVDDVTKAAVTLTDTTGAPIPNPVTVNKLGFGPKMKHETLDRLGWEWEGGGLSGVIISYEGMKEEAVAARQAAEAAASTAGAEAVADVEARIAAGEFVGAPGQDGSNVLPTDTAIRDAINDTGSATRGALNATYAGKAVVPRSLPNGKPFPRLNLVESMQAGHGFTYTNIAVPVTLNDTSDYVIGTQSAKFTTIFNATASGGGIVKTGRTPLDMTGKGLLVWIKVETPDLTNLAFLNIELGDDSFTNRYRAQYFGLGNEPFKANEWYPLQIAWANFEANKAGAPTRESLTAIRIQAAEGSGKPAVVVHVGGIATFVESSSKYPTGVVSFGFDDSFAAHWTTAVPKLSTYGYSATLFPIIDRLGTAGYLTLAQVKAMQNTYGWEVGAHASSVAAHTSYTTKTDAQIEAEMVAIRTWQAENGLLSSNFAWPVGYYTAENAARVAKHYASARATGGYHDAVDVSDTMRISSHTLVASISLATAKTYVDQAVAGKSWLKLCVHNLVTSGATGNDWLIADFNALVDYIAASGIAVASFRDVQGAQADVSVLMPKLGTKTDTSAGLFDWQNNAASGYLLHLRTGPNSSGSGVIGIGTDLGAGNGLLISHKNTGIGVVATGQPGSGKIAEFTSRGSGSGFWANVQAGGGAFQVNARDGQGYSDGASTSGSTTFTSATAAFAAGDVGKSIVQLTSKGTTDPFGSIPSGTTIASVTNSTTVELSQPATATGTSVLFNVTGRIPAATQALFKVMETDLVTELVKFTRGGATFNTADVASTVLRVNAKSGQTADIFQVYDGASAKVFSLAANGGITSGVIANFTNGALLGATPMQVSTYSSHATIKAGRLGAGTGDNFWAMGAGTTALSRFNKDGYFMTTKSAAPADADINAGELALWVDTTAGAAKLMIKAKDSAGTVKTGSVTLA